MTDKYWMGFLFLIGSTSIIVFFAWAESRFTNQQIGFVVSIIFLLCIFASLIYIFFDLLIKAIA